jgi:hypothetical protein
MVLHHVKNTYQRIRAFAKRCEHYFMPLMLVAGTAMDAWQFRVLSIRTTFLISGVYAVMCALATMAMAAPPQENRHILRYVQIAAPFLQQFTIGALLSTSFLFYWFNGSLSASWPVIGAFALLMVFNEVFRKVFVHPVVQTGVLYFALFSLFATLSAYAFNSLSPWVFVGGGVASLLVIALFTHFFLKVDHIARHRGHMIATIGTIFIAMNAAYFLNLIPPIPLSLRKAGMYYQVVWDDGDYKTVGEEETWFQKLIPGQALYPDGPIYAFTSIYAPADLSTTIVHRWEYDDEDKGWVIMDDLSFPVIGGRDEGYRGYSKKTTFKPGKWRVTVMTERGQVLGRIPFTIVIAK